MNKLLHEFCTCQSCYVIELLVKCKHDIMLKLPIKGGYYESKKNNHLGDWADNYYYCRLCCYDVV